MCAHVYINLPVMNALAHRMRKAYTHTHTHCFPLSVSRAPDNRSLSSISISQLVGLGLKQNTQFIFCLLDRNDPSARSLSFSLSRRFGFLSDLCISLDKNVVISKLQDAKKKQ